MACFLRYCIFGLLSLSVLTAEAARQKPVVRPASAQDVFVKGGTTLDIDRHWGEILDVPGGRTTLPVTHKSGYSFARVGNMLKTAINSNPAKYAATAAVTYLISQLPGASFDPVTGELVSHGDINTTFTYYSGQYGPHSSVLDACKSYSQLYIIRGAAPDGNSYYCGTQSQTIRTIFANTRTCPYGHTGLACNQHPPAPMPFTPSDFDALVSNTPDLTESHWQELGPELLADIPATFDGPDSQEFTGLDQVTGTPTITTTLDQVSGTTTVVESTPVHNFDYSTNPLSITTTTTTTNNTYQNGTLVSTTTQTQGQPSTEVSEVPLQLEIPTDCDFMPTVCSFIDWVKTPFNEEEPDLSELIADEDFEKEINFSSNATCPGPSMISTSKGDFEFSWEPGCQWAGMIKPFFIIGALIAAIYINLGIARSSD